MIPSNQTPASAGDMLQYDFSPGVLGVQQRPPSPLPRMVLGGVLLLLVIMLLWAMLGRLDIVSVAEGKLVPVSYIKIVQPSEAGIVKEIAIKEGQTVVKSLSRNEIEEVYRYGVDLFFNNDSYLA